MISATAALIVVDLQEDFLPPNGALAVTGGREVINVINGLMENHDWRIILASKDWHPQDHCSFASNNRGVKPFQNTTFKNPDNGAEVKDLTAWPDHCVQGTFGAGFPDEFTGIQRVDKIINKGFLSDREYYSAFQDVFGIHKTDLQDYLVNSGVQDVYITGLALDFCVYHTALDAAKLGWNTFVVQDASKPVNPKSTQEVLLDLKAHGVRIVSSKDL
jgi:nicotinamidase